MAWDGGAASGTGCPVSRLGHRFVGLTMTSVLNVEACIVRYGCLGVAPWGFAPPDLRNMSPNMTGQTMAG